MILRDFVNAAAHFGVDAGRGPPQAGVVHLVADRPRPCAARRGDRARAAHAACPASRSTGWPRTRSRACSKRRASASTRRAPSWPASPHTSSPSQPSTTCTASRRCGAWTRSSSTTSWSSTTSIEAEPYDLWIGDEAWELDYYLHENPERSAPPYVWLTDFVGWLPMPDGGEREAFLTADYNAEMVEHIARYPRRARPGDLRRQPRRHRPRPARTRSCR